MDESKNENGLFARGSVSALSPSSLGVISSIPPPISGLKGLTSGAAGAYVAGGGEIDGAGLRDGGPVAAFAPFAPAPPSRRANHRQPRHTSYGLQTRGLGVLYK